MSFTRGSEWRRWDLHFHTPSSGGNDYLNMQVTNEQIVQGLTTNDVAVVAITDHHFIDAPRILELRQIAGASLTVLPGIELRTSLGGSESVHIIGIWPERLDMDQLWREIDVRLNLSKQQQSEGWERVYVDLGEAANVIRGTDGLVSIHVGRKSNSIERIANAEQFKQAIKRDIVREHIDIMEVGQVRDIADYTTIVFPHIGAKYPLVLCSDNHDISNYEVKAPLWIKADPTFRGLRQILLEPEDRVFVGSLPPHLGLVQSQPIHFIDAIQIQKQSDVSSQENWFDTSLPINTGLVAIIGNKGSGKSALADVAALLSNTRRFEHFSFLNDKRFCRPPDNLARQYQGTLTWRSGFSSTKNLDETPARHEVEGVTYLPQNFIENICNAIGTKEKSSFDRELESVIYSHVTEADKMGFESLDELLTHLNKESKEALQEQIQDQRSENQRVLHYEARQAPDYVQSLSARRKLLEDKLEVLNKRKPSPVEPPSDTKDGKLRGRLDVTLEARRTLQERVEHAKSEKSKVAADLAAARKLEQRLANLSDMVKRFEVDSQEDMTRLSLTPAELFEFKVIPSRLEKIKAALDTQSAKLDAELDPNEPGSLTHSMAAREDEINLLQEQLSKPEKLYHQYQEKLRAWQHEQNELTGSPEKPGSLAHVAGQQKELKEIPTILKDVYRRRNEKVLSICGVMSALADTYRRLYRPVQDFIDGHSQLHGQLSLTFEVSITDVGFIEGFFEFVRRDRGKGFRGEAEGTKHAQSLLDSCNFNDPSSVVEFLENIMKELKKYGPLTIEENNLRAPYLKSGKSISDFYDWLFSLSFLEPRYRLSLDGKDLSQLSPGEKGALLLIFYLVIDKNQNPIIIDQPEENLDNQTVFETLVPCIKIAKMTRQIMLVTHNPNLAVVCDADQVIHARMDRSAPAYITYYAGSIENAETKNAIVDVLEGTMPAFENREHKYHIE